MARALVPGLRTLACLLAAAPATAQVNYGVFGDTAYVRSSLNASGDAVIASTFNGYPVTAILGWAFTNCTSLTSVTIPNSVRAIGVYAFSRCTNLANVIIGNNVTSFSGQAFALCNNPTNFTFLGNAPWLVDGAVNNVGAGAKAYYSCGTTGWGATYGGLPTVMLCPPQIAPGSAGMKPGGFGFTLTRPTNQAIVVEASTNPVNWQPIWTNAPPTTSANFVDPEWLNYSNRFYRARSD